MFKGAVPKYLTDRKDEWARQEEERIKNLPDPDCPINVKTLMTKIFKIYK